MHLDTIKAFADNFVKILQSPIHSQTFWFYKGGDQAAAAVVINYLRAGDFVFNNIEDYRADTRKWSHPLSGVFLNASVCPFSA